MATKTRTSPRADRLQQAFERWKTMAELQLQFIETLGNYKLTTARAELVRAVMAGQWAVARMKAQVVDQLERSLRRMWRLRNQTDRRVRRLDRQAKAAARIRDGQQLEPSQLARMWAAYTVFERATPMGVLETIINSPLEPESQRGMAYADLRHPESPCANPPSSVDNVHALIHWIRRRRYMPKKGTQAYRQIVGAFADIAAVADLEIERLQQQLLALEQRTYDTWKPLAVAALPDSVDVKKITRIGTR